MLEVGEQTLNKPPPLQAGMETLWETVFASVLKCTPGERPLLLGHGCRASKGDGDRIAELVFEAMGVQHFHYIHEAVLPLYAAGHTTGVSVSCGHGITSVVPVHEGYPMEFAMPDHKFNVAGTHLHDMFVKLMADRGHKVWMRVCGCVSACAVGRRQDCSWCRSLRTATTLRCASCASLNSS